ncbi:hypothetical protein MAHJHV61_24490 [Mycobacterium avium subsp. hominissuis]
MTEAYIYEAIRTPRGKGRASGALHSVKPISLVVGLIDEQRRRFPDLDEDRISDVVLGVVTPVGDQGMDIARTAVTVAGLPDTVGGVQLNRFCGSGLDAVNVAAKAVRSGFDELVIAGGVESMSRVEMGSDRGAMAYDAATAYDNYFIPQGVAADLLATIEGYTREDVDAYAVRSQRRAAEAWSGGLLREICCAGAGYQRVDHPGSRRAHAAGQHGGGPGQVGARVRGHRRVRWFRRRRDAALPLGRSDQPRAHWRQQLGHCGRRLAGAGR